MEEKDKGTGDLKDWLSERKREKNVPDQKDVPEDEKQTLIDSEEEKKEEDKKKEREEEEGKGLAEFETPPDKEVVKEEEKEDAETLIEKEEVKSEDSKWPPRKIRSKDIELPKGVHALFLLIDIAGPVRDIRGLPDYFQIERTRTLIGRYAKARVHLDDPDTVKNKHAKLLYEEREEKREFVLYPIDNARISVNGSMVYREGVVLKSGDMVEIGSAELVFFYKDLERDK